jgi:hypothetical protein
MIRPLKESIEVKNSKQLLQIKDPLSVKINTQIFMLPADTSKQI